MVNLDAGSTLKRLRNRYRLVVMNDDTYEEVVTFKLSRMSVYVMLSTVFVLLVGLTVALIVFTPLKYYIPGYDDPKAGREYRQLKYKADDMAKKMNDLENYNTALRNTLTGNTAIVLDTTQLKVPKQELSND